MKQSPYEMAVDLEQKLLCRGVRFRPDGLPEFPEELVLQDFPRDLEIRPFAFRRKATRKSSTLLCSFVDDVEIYRRLDHLESDFCEYQSYLGFCGFDLSARGGTDVRLQRFNLLLNALANTYLAISTKVPLLPNFRIGGIGTLNVLSLYPRGSAFVVGALGCARGNVGYNCACLRTKLAFARPSKLFIYGTLRSEYAQVLAEESVSYEVFADYRTSSYAASEGKAALRGL